jgi:nucleoid DNA-binding protein
VKKTQVTNQKKHKPGVFRTNVIKDWVTEQDVYQGFRYKKRRIEVNPKTGKTMVYAAPYIKLKESSSHEFSLTFDKWLEILKMYFTIISEKLAQGHEYEFPRNMGKILLIRKRPKENVIRGGKLFRNSHTLGYKPLLIWKRITERDFLHKKWYVFNLSRKIQWPIISKAIYSTPSIIYKYPE